MLDTTPVRRLGTVDDRGLRVLSDPGLTYADGAEERLATIVGGATDISSSSEELARAATDWGTTYSLVATRSNIVRALDLRPEMKVLEIGCGCGPITRYLGETCEVVDSIEPMPARAHVARLRTRDLESVEVCVGTLDDVPAEPTYDVVVVIGVLEYVGGGTADPAPYLKFLQQCHAVLKEGGTLALAIENPLGVKYISGAVEDHTNRPFDSLEGYVLDSPARTFTRRTLDAMLSASGFEPTFLAAFPDYKLPRAMIADDLFRRSDELVARMPRFPSPDYLVSRLNLSDEALTWRTLVDSGTAEHFANSFLTVSTKGQGPALWPADRLGLLFSTERRPPYVVRGEVQEVDGELAIRRRPLYADRAADDSADWVRHDPSPLEPVAQGDEMVRRLLEHPDERAVLLRRWVDLLPADDAEWMPVDLVPHNMIVDTDGMVAAIDQEWSARGFARSTVLVRGLLYTAVQMAQITRPERLLPWATVEDVVRDLAAEGDIDVSPEVYERFLDQESRFLATVTPASADLDGREQRARDDLDTILHQPLVEVRGGERFDQQWARAVADLGGHDVKVAAVEKELAQLRARVQEEHVRAERAERQRERLMRGTILGNVLRVRRRLRRMAAERSR